MKRLVLAGLFGLGLPLAAAALPSPAGEWYLLESRGLVALTDGNPDQAEALIGELLSFDAAMKAALPEGPDADGRPLMIYLFRDDATFQRYKPIVRGRPSSAAGFFMPRREGAFVAMGTSRASSLRIVRHELVHFAMHRLLGGAPPWLDEGMAEYLAAGRVEAREFVLGEPLKVHRDRLLGSARASADKVVRLPVFEAAHTGSGQPGHLYAESWALVHWLRTGGEAERALFDSLLAELTRRGPEAPDLIELGEFENGALDGRLAAHLRRDPLPLERIAIPKYESPALTRRRVNREVALASLGELLFALGRHAEAEEHFEAAGNRRDTLARAWRGLGLLQEAAGEVSKARPLFERAAELAPKDPEVLLSLGRNLVGITAPDFDADKVPRRDVLRSREVLSRAVSLAPNRAELLAALGLAGLMAEKGADAETGAALEIAHEVLPHRSDIAYHLMLWHLRRDELEKGLALLDEVVLPREEAGSELALRAGNIATTACIERARQLRREGEREAAESLLEDRLAAGVSELLRPQVLRELRASRPLP